MKNESRNRESEIVFQQNTHLEKTHIKKQFQMVR